VIEWGKRLQLFDLRIRAKGRVLSEQVGFKPITLEKLL
jgi:hypothetical protein